MLVNGATVDTITPNGTNYGAYTTAAFTVTSGTHTITLQGLSPSTADSTAFVNAVSVGLAAGTVQSWAASNGSFQSPLLAAGAYKFSPAGSSWLFLGSAGVSSNQSAFTAGNPNAPAGTQVAFIKDAGSASQTAAFSAGAYQISFEAAQRGNWQSQAQQIEVLVDGSVVSTITPTSTSYALYKTANFSLSAGTHTITFLGLAPPPPTAPPSSIR